jgi:SAM-dependent methyltransferase
VKALLKPILRAAPLQPFALWLLRQRGGAFNKVHPFDRAHGVDTSGLIPAEYLFGDEAASEATVNAGCVPSAVRAALQTIPDLEGASFLDLGCGKGRALIAARAFPFSTLRGIELNPTLAAMARANGVRAARKTPKGAALEITVGDATQPDLPAGDVLVFMYHPFGRPLIERVCARLVDFTRQRSSRIFVVYENPVHGAVFDAAPEFTRWFAGQIPYAPEEIGFGPDTDEAVVVWASAAAGRTPYDAGGRIVETKPGWRVEIR